jgi:hypothetical protein
MFVIGAIEVLYKDKMGLHIDSCGWFPCAIDKDYAFGSFQVGSLGKDGRYQVIDHGFDISFLQQVCI